MKLKRKKIEQICSKLGEKLTRFKFLGRGSHNENFLIVTEKNKFVLRIENDFKLKNLKTEYKFLKMTKGKFGPKVFLFDNSGKVIPRDYLVEEFIEGRHPKKCTNKFIKDMGKWYKKLHKIKIKKPAKLLSKRDGIKRYKKFRKVLDKKYLERMDELFSKWIKIFNQNKDLFDDKYLVLNQGDPWKENMFYVKGKLKLIDWEFVGWDVPEADLVFFIWAYKLNKRQKEFFLKTYGYSKSEKRLNLMFIVHNLSMISWRMKKLSFIPKNKKQIYKRNEQDIKKIIKTENKIK
jgi:aminoglycoside phosphotransferase (APT) family kinase protein